MVKVLGNAGHGPSPLLNLNCPTLNRWPSGAQTGLMRASAMSGASSYPCCSTEDVAMRTFDFSPFARSAIGFDTIFDRLNDWSKDTNEGYPPYDIVRKGEDEFQINIAVAGFSPDEISITAEANLLTVAGKKHEKPEAEYLYQGISARSFERHFNLADYIE